MTTMLIVFAMVATALSAEQRYCPPWPGSARGMDRDPLLSWDTRREPLPMGLKSVDLPETRGKVTAVGLETQGEMTAVGLETRWEMTAVGLETRGEMTSVGLETRWEMTAVALETRGEMTALGLD